MSDMILVRIKFDVSSGAWEQRPRPMMNWSARPSSWRSRYGVPSFSVQ